ncbi:MAG TPA: Hpt domain-containing protein [Telluria sp.]|jgi:HPt (histidine-containing phosphotransfer) domain-containing protein
MASPIDQEFFARLRALNDKFAASIPETLARMRQQRSAFDPAAPNEETIKTLREILHTIAGSAATFGFRVFGQKARELEQRLRVLTSFAAVPADNWQRWLDDLDDYLAWADKNPRADDPAGSTHCQ